jgi:hypothetical protein
MLINMVGDNGKNKPSLYFLFFSQVVIIIK